MFLHRIDAIIDGKRIERVLLKHYRKVASADGRPAYPALPMFTVLLLQRWYGLERPRVRGSGHRSDLLYPLQRVLPLQYPPGSFHPLPVQECPPGTESLRETL